MSLDDLLPLLLVAFFIVNAFLRGGRRQRQRGQGRGTQRGRGQAPSGPQAGDAPASEATNVQDVLAKRLEEARRRVRASTGADSQGGSSSTSTSSSSAPSAPAASTTRASTGGASPSPAAPPASPPAPRQAASPPAFLGREGLPPRADDRSAPPPGFLGREGMPKVERRQPTREARTRPMDERSARLPAAVGIDIDPDDVVRGMIWSEVLGPPLSARRRRRTVSRRRSH